MSAMRAAFIFGEDRATRLRRLGGAALVVLALALYANALRAPFVFDDQSAILGNRTLRVWSPWWTPLFPPLDAGGVVGRPLVNLSLALNYALGGESPAGYHAVNILLHGAVAWLLFAIVRRTLARVSAGERVDFFAWSIAAVWTVHPLLTESVTCVIQRNEVMASACVLGALYGFIRASEAGAAARNWRWLSVAACTLGMLCKEIAVVTPLVVLLYDRAFVTGSFGGAWRERRGYYLSLLATWLLLAVIVFSHGGTRGGTAGFGGEIGVAEYLPTQARAILQYLRLAFWPHPLVLDYGAATVAWSDAILPGLGVLVLLGVSLALLMRQPRIGFVAATFFVLLAPSSSFVPLATQTIAEHRMYLPLACVVVLVALGLRRVTRHAAWVLLGLCMPFAAATVARNELYRNPLALWEQTVRAAPQNSRAHIQLGNAYVEAGRRVDANAEFRRALELKPTSSSAQMNIGTLLLLQRRPLEALPILTAAVNTNPNNPAVRNSYAAALDQLGRKTEALKQYRYVVQLAPEMPQAHHNLALSLLEHRRVPEAIAEFETAARLMPGYREPRVMLQRLGRVPPP
jgi:Tfp pilus assembly protein PilF